MGAGGGAAGGAVGVGGGGGAGGSAVEVASVVVVFSSVGAAPSELLGSDEVAPSNAYWPSKDCHVTGVFG